MFLLYPDFYYSLNYIVNIIHIKKLILDQYNIYTHMKPHSYFENILKHKRYFNNKEIALMTPKQILSYIITGHIKRIVTSQEIKQLQNFVKKLKIKK